MKHLCGLEIGQWGGGKYVYFGTCHANLSLAAHSPSISNMRNVSRDLLWGFVENALHFLKP